MKANIILYFSLIILVNCNISWANDLNLPKIEPFWNLPLELNSTNTKISFEIDSTWHLAHFDVKEVNGKIWLEDPNNFMSIQANVHLSVNSFDSDNSFRDKKTQKVMASDLYPEVHFHLISLEGLCSPLEITEHTECPIKIKGKLKIRDSEQDFTFPAIINRLGSKYQIKGAATLDWSTYGVEDPSILLAKVEREVKIEILIQL